MAKTVSEQVVGGVTYQIADKSARQAVSDEATARENAVAELAQKTYDNRNLPPSAITNLNNITDNSVYTIANTSSVQNKPAPLANTSFTLITSRLTAAGDRIQQIAIGYTTERVFSRACGNGSWTAWNEITAFQSTGNLPDGSDLNDLTYQTVATVQSGASHIPAHYPAEFGTGAGIIITIAPNNFGDGIFLIQFAISLLENRILKRHFFNTWSNWETPGKSYANRGVLTAENNLNDIAYESVYSVATQTTPDQPANYPMSGNRAGFVISTSAFNNSSFVAQMVLPFSGLMSDALVNRKELAMHIRVKSGNDWNNWRYFKLTPRNAVGKYFAFGDSTTWGYSADHNHDQSPWNYPALIGDLTGVEVHNAADPGQGLLKNWNTATSEDASVVGTINNMISNNDFDNAVLITVGWAYNDADYYSAVDFGNPTDAIPAADTGITTWLGYYARVMAKLQGAAPSAMVVLVTGFGYTTATEGHKTDEQFTKTRTFRDGSKTIRQMYDALEEMANYNGWYCINQAKGSAINKVNGSNIIGDSIHPTYDNYRIYGNFIASRVAALFQNL